MRYSIKNLLAVTTLVAVTLVCMLYPIPLLAGLFYFAAFLMIVMAVILATQTAGESRSFWTCFAIAAASYLWIATPSPAEREYSSRLSGNEAAAVRAGFSMLPAIAWCMAYEGLAERRGLTPIGRLPRGDAWFVAEFSSFRTIGESGLSLLLGLFGGQLGRWSRRRSLQSTG